jgi:hypothetical protein
MADSKIEFSYDNLRFVCEGDKEWVEAQLNKVLNRIHALNKPSRSVLPARAAKTEPVEEVRKAKAAVETTAKAIKGRRGRKPKAVTESVKPEPFGNPLYEFLKDKRADKNQVRKFLATAVYLHSQGLEKYSSPLIASTLKNEGIEKLLNASDCLNKNEKKGFCLKDKKEFILTDLGIQSILGAEEE